jgi:hypothetical protein
MHGKVFINIGRQMDQKKTQEDSMIIGHLENHPGKNLNNTNRLILEHGEMTNT